VKRASDLMSPYVGQTEHNMAEMFREGALDRAVLLLDEADSFLRPRSEAVRSWEVTQVNEMLTQMEAYRGVFIATTNRLEAVDEAALRRFDLKVGLTWLAEEPRWLLFQQLCQELGIPAGDGLPSPLKALHHLTPGDFATVLRQSRFRPVSHSEELLERLQKECALKPVERQRAIGF